MVSPQCNSQNRQIISNVVNSECIWRPRVAVRVASMNLQDVTATQSPIQ